MLTLREGIVELYKKVATSLPKDVEDALKAAFEAAREPVDRDTLGGILKRVVTARTTGAPLCEDTGYPVFFVRVPKGLSHRHIRDVITEATRIATRKIPLRPNAVNAVTEENTGDNVGDHFPLIHVEESEEHSLVVDLMLRGGDCENLGKAYSLPARLERRAPAGGTVVAERGFEGVRQCVIDAVSAARRGGCPPYILGVAIGGLRDLAAYLSKKQLLRKIGDTNPNGALAELERAILEAACVSAASSGSATAGPSVMAVKVATASLHPDSYFVDVSFACWASRRGRLIW